MSKFLITRRSQNPVTGPILVTTSPRKTCPNACPLRRSANGDLANVCYAEHGMLGGFLWSKLDRLPAGGRFQKGQIRINSFEELCAAVRALPDGSLWRHNQAGDLPTTDNETIDADELNILVAANDNKRGFTYTHFDVVDNKPNRETVKAANDNGFTINLSANSLLHADELYDVGCGPVAVVVEADVTENLTTPKGRKIVICPARLRRDVTCETCRLCARQRDFIIGLPALGRRKDRLKAANDNDPPSP